MYTDPTSGRQNPPTPQQGYNPYPQPNPYTGNATPQQADFSRTPEMNYSSQMPGYNRQQPANPYYQNSAYAMNGYQQAGIGYSVPQTGAYQSQPAQGINGQNGYQQPGGSFIPQTPYSQGYASPGYQMPSGYNQPGGLQGNGYQQANGYYQGNAYIQNIPQQNGNGYAPQGYVPSQGSQRQVPINGGGYIPDKVPVRKKPFVFDDFKLLLLGAVLLVLFIVGLSVREAGLRKAFDLIFVILAGGSIALFWVKPMITENKRLCFSIVFGALIVASIVGMLSAGTGNNSGNTHTMSSTPTNSTVQVTDKANSNVVIDGRTGQVISGTDSQPTPEPTAEKADTSATDRLMRFFYYWSANKQDDMLSLCSPSWQSNVESPKVELFKLMANRIPMDYEVNNITGTDDDTTRNVTVTSTIDRNNGKPASRYRLTIIMVKESGEWYVDPNSLKTYEAAETTPPSATVTPTSAPAISPGTVLYYNPEGGTKYHLDQNCKSTHAKYLPMKGHFTYSEVNDTKYASLQPCNVCAAPLR